MMIRWWEHCEKGVRDGHTYRQTDRQTDWTIHRAAWSQLKTIGHIFTVTSSFVLHFIAIYQFKMELQSGNTKFGSKSEIFLSRVTLKFDGWTWKTMGHLFYAPSSFVYHFIAFCEIKMKWQSGNTKFGSKSMIFLPCVTLKFDRWPWKTIGHLFYATSSLVHHFIAICEFKNGVTIRKHQIWVEISDFLSCVTLKFDGWPWNTIGHLFYATSSFMHHFIAIREFKMELQSGNAKFGSKSAIFCPVWPWPLTSDLDLLHGYHFCHW